MLAIPRKTAAVEVTRAISQIAPRAAEIRESGRRALSTVSGGADAPDSNTRLFLGFLTRVYAARVYCIV